MTFPISNSSFLPQRKRLFALADAAQADFVYVERRGDVAFISFAFLRTYEFVSASPNEKDPKRCYDIWKNGDLFESDRTLSEVLEWLKSVDKK